jgi:hypothetical protein
MISSTAHASRSPSSLARLVPCLALVVASACVAEPDGSQQPGTDDPDGIADGAGDGVDVLAHRRVKIGMSAAASEWNLRLSQTGPVYARRIFGKLGSFTSTVNLARSEVAAGRMPILSFKLPAQPGQPADWAGAAAGDYDDLLEQLADELATPRSPRGSPPTCSTWPRSSPPTPTRAASTRIPARTPA